MEALVDISSKLSVSNTAYGSTPTYKYSVPFDKYVLIRQIAIGADSDFIATGLFQLKINGSNATSQATANTEVGVIGNLAIEFGEKDFIYVEPQGTVEINMRVSSGSGTAQVIISGTVLSRNEFEKVRAKYLAERV